MTTSREKLVDEHYRAFKKLFDVLCKKFSLVERKYKPSGKYSTTRKFKKKQLLQLYGEVIIILSRIDKHLNTLRKLDKRSRPFWESQPGGPVPKNTTFYHLLNRERILKEHLLVDIKSLFHWVFIIDEVLGKNVLPKHVTAYRNLFLVHFYRKAINSRKVRRLTSGTLFSGGSVKLLLIPFRGTKKFSGFKTNVEKKVVKYIPEIKYETNNHEKVRMVWENIDKLPNSLKSGN